MKIVDLNVFRAMKNHVEKKSNFKKIFHSMQKAELLQELIQYNDRYMKDPSDIDLTIRTQVLMEVLEERAELNELRELSQQFNEKLSKRLSEQLRRTS